MYEVGIFGGSFDPIHNGHINILQYIENIGLCKTLFCIPAFHNPHKTTLPEASVEDRLNMISLALAEFKLKNVRISKFEANHHNDSYTIDTILYFVNRYKIEDKLALILGADSFNDVLNWYKIEKIAKYSDLIIIPRPGFDIQLSESISKLFKVCVLDKITVHDAQSHELRRSKSGLKSNIPSSVYAYIVEKKLYGT